MKVKKNMLHKDLQSYYRSINALRLIFENKWLLKPFNAITALITNGKNVKDLDCSEVYVLSSDGKTKIRARIYKPKSQQEKLPIMLYIHGGGYISGTPEMAAGEIKKFIQKRPCVVISPDYRLALKAPYPAAFNDCYDTMLWAKNNADQLGINNDKFIIAGHSAGGGLTAAVTLKARDTKDVNIAFQMPIYPMIDDTQPTDKSREIYNLTWDNTTNTFGWKQYLRGIKAQGKEVPAYAAPARNKDYLNFPPTISFVGTLEPFYKETEQYINALKNADIDVKFKIFEDCFHGFEAVASKTSIGQEGQKFTYDSYAEFYDKYVSL
ncbi:alpha/beta hydrolase [Aequorivita marina]|uniref:alpha/beta hydrolase n=1 Tax=Aequorivita marina TaxID=3073654 RepID=UPI0028742D6E|nr:alpha/beta hydrolase [Aequorivita sp. S2608]MDS1299405.1 alpha/beta hydrolase [Aequorivita sp. S2608]